MAKLKSFLGAHHICEGRGEREREREGEREREREREGEGEARLVLPWSFSLSAFLLFPFSSLSFLVSPSSG